MLRPTNPTESNKAFPVCFRKKKEMGSERVELYGRISSHYANVVVQLPRDHSVFPWIQSFSLPSSFI